MNRVAACVAEVVEICSGGEEAASTKYVRARIDGFYTSLGMFLKDWPHQDGSEEVKDLIDQLTSASKHAAEQNAFELSERLQRCVDYVRAARRCGRQAP